MRTLMNIPAVIRRFVDGEDPYGNTVRTGEYVDTPVRCWLTPVPPRAGEDEDRVNRDQATYMYKLFVPATVSITHRDQVIVSDNPFAGSGDDLGLVVEVVGSPFAFRGRNGRVHHYEAPCRKVEG
jgi:hypothetical protein